MSDLDAAFARILDGQAAHDEIMRFMAHSIERMRDPEALAAGARAMRARMVCVQAPDGAIDVCGTGGDGAKTLNISTAVAFVVAGAGVPVAKHGNRAMSSQSGAADVLEALGVKLTAHVPTLERCLREANIAFLHAQHHHPAVRHVAAARKEFGQRTIFNLLGPLSNPAGVKRQLLGVFGADFVQPMAEALKLLGSELSYVVHGAGGLDELSLVEPGQNKCIRLENGELFNVAVENREFAEPGTVPHAPSGDLKGGNAAHNAAALRDLLSSKSRGSAYENAVLLNATYALMAAQGVTAPKATWALALDSIRSNAALGALKTLVEITQSSP